jgi:hypothetical protein
MKFVVFTFIDIPFLGLVQVEFGGLRRKLYLHHSSANLKYSVHL